MDCEKVHVGFVKMVEIDIFMNEEAKACGLQISNDYCTEYIMGLDMEEMLKMPVEQVAAEIAALKDPYLSEMMRAYKGFFFSGVWIDLSGIPQSKLVYA